MDDVTGRTLREALEGWDVSAVDAQYKKTWALFRDHPDADVRCAIANLRNANMILNKIKQFLVQADNQLW